MKILYIYNDYRRRRRIYGDIMSSLGHDVKYLNIVHKREKNTIHVKQIKKYNSDLVLIMTPYYVSHGMDGNVCDYLKSKRIPLVIYSTINPSLTYEEQLKIWEKMDISFVVNKDFCNFLKKKGLNAHYMPMGFHSSQYYKSVSSSRIYDVSFMGTPLMRCKDKRSKYLQSLVDEKYKVGVYGKNFSKKMMKVKVIPFRTHDEQRAVYSKTKINLDLPYIDGVDFYKNKYHLKNRFFEIPATRNFLLTVRCPEFLDIFAEDTVGYYDDNIGSLKENIKKYLKDDNLRKKMAKKAYRLVYEKHTFYHRFKKIFKIIES